MTLARARTAVGAAFLAQGLVFISLTTRLPRLQDRWDLDELALSGLLLMMVLLAGAGSVLAERAAERHTAPGCCGSGCSWWRWGAGARARARLRGAGRRPGDVRRGPRGGRRDQQHAGGGAGASLRTAILPSFHGWWTVGGIIGATLTLASSGLPWDTAAGPWSRCWSASGRSCAHPDPGRPRPGPATSLGGRSSSSGSRWCSSTWSTRRRPPGARRTSTTRSRPPPTWSRWPRSPTWWPPAWCACPGTGWCNCSAPSWCCGWGPWWPPCPAGVVTAPTWPVAVVGFTVLGAGVAVIAPLSFSAAARIAGGSPGPRGRVIGRFNQFNYVGALLGSVLTGVVGADSLRVGFAVPWCWCSACSRWPARSRPPRSPPPRLRPWPIRASPSTSTSTTW